MNVFEAIRARYSVRKYQSRDVEDDKLRRVFEAARLAPSASNRQEWRFIAVKNPESREALRREAKIQRFIAEAPVLIVCCAETDNHVMSCGQLAYPIDVAIAIDHLTLQAVEEGLGTCWIGAFNENKVKALLGIPHEIRVVELLTLGYPADEQRAKKRKSLDEIVMDERWRV